MVVISYNRVQVVSFGVNVANFHRMTVHSIPKKLTLISQMTFVCTVMTKDVFTDEKHREH